MNASYPSTAVGLLVFAGLASADPEGAGSAIRPEAARVFPTKVQPILMNLCASCHCRPDHPGTFKLSRVSEGYTNSQSTNRNLRAAAAHVRADDPASSPLLAKAVTPHGGAQDPPLYGRGHPAFRNLEAWAMAALFAPPRQAQPVQTLGVFGTNPVPAARAAGNSEEPAGLPAVPPAEPAPLPPPQGQAVTAKPNPDDPFDPAEFNRAAHGGK